MYIDEHAGGILRRGKPVYKVVFTGGPCGGKSSSLASVVDRLSSLGFRTYASPEIATILIGAGARPTFPGWTPEVLVRFQEGIIRTSMAIEVRRRRKRRGRGGRFFRCIRRPHNCSFAPQLC